jgi:hypothetical protein
MAVGLVQALDVSLYYPIATLLCSMFDPVTIVRLRRTCKALSRWYDWALGYGWNVERRLSMFFTFPREFREEMRKQDALISGSVALQFFDRVRWETSDLDVFVREHGQADALGVYLQESEGYEVVESPPFIETEVDEYEEVAVCGCPPRRVVEVG